MSRLSRSQAFATVLVLWAVALMALILTALQSSAFRQAADGREAVARVRAHWAARAGVEVQIARLTFNTITPDQTSATTLGTDLASVARGDLPSSTYVVRHFNGGKEVDGPLDAHSKLNVNRLDAEDLILLDSMDEATAQSIENWIRGTSETGGLGADAGSYTGLKYPYEPREAPVRSLKELELIQGVDAKLLLGEDANANNLLDASEDDSEASSPPDNADGALEPGWSKFLTAVSELGVSGGYGLSGTKRLDLSAATSGDIASRLNVDNTQAEAIRTHAASDGSTLADFVRSNLADLASAAQQTTLLTGQNSNVRNLSEDQLKTLLDETYIAAELRSEWLRTGRININTVSRETLERFAKIDSALADTIINDRDGRSGGYVSLTDMLQIPNFSTTQLADLMAHFDVRSNVFVVTSRGRDKATGREVEIVATLDRSVLPVVIRDLIVR
ncbi:MAG: general secretion pathway protein GspK [Phycisphaerales bacterium]|nr:general secretion pathway protein GspK [Phycisphaerales bacterium]